MFKVGRWRGAKNKIKAAFKLQFQLTQAPTTGSEVIVSLIPVDTGKPTARSEKVVTVDGTCSWVIPVYETVKLVRDLKTGKINEKVYHFIVSATGSVKGGILGEGTVNLADYAEAFKESSISLPLQASNTGATLHVTIQRMETEGDGREAGEKGNTMLVKQQRETYQSQLTKGDKEEGLKVRNGTNNINPVRDDSFINMSAHVKFPSSSDISFYDDSNKNLMKSHSFDVISVSGSETNSGSYNPIENNMNQRDSTNIISSLSHATTPQKLMTSSGDWSSTSVPDGSSDGPFNSSCETELGERSQFSDDPLEKLRSEVVLLKRKVEISDLELQTLRKQVVKENRCGRDLSIEISNLKKERDALERECEELRASKRQKNSPVNSQLIEDPLSALEEIKQELNHEKILSSNLRLQLQKAQEANAELILAVRNLGELLEQRNKETFCIKCNKVDAETDITQGKEPGKKLQHLQSFICKNQLFDTNLENDAEEQHALDLLLMEHDNFKGGLSQHKDVVELNNEVEFYIKERDDLEMQMEQLALDYEILKQENHDISSKLEQTKLREQLMMQYECSAHLAIITDLEAHVKNLEKEIQQQTESFKEDLETIILEKVEQEKRAIKAEEELRKTKWHNANTADHLQAEIKSLAAQISYAFFVDEKLVMQALKETTKLRSEKSSLDEQLEKTNKNHTLIQDQYHMKFQQILALADFKSQEQTDRLVLELKEKQEELEKCKQTRKAKLKTFEDIDSLKSEMEKLKTEKYFLLQQVEQKEKIWTQMEELKISAKASQAMNEDKKLENEMLKKELLQLKGGLTKSMNEKDDLTDVKNDKDVTIRIVGSGLANLRLESRDPKDSMLHELEKEIDRPFAANMIHKKEEEMENHEITDTKAQTKLAESAFAGETETNDVSNKIGINLSKNDKHSHKSSQYNTYEVQTNGDCEKQTTNGNKRIIEEMDNTVEEPKISNFGALSEEQKVNFGSTDKQHMEAEVLNEIAVLKRQNEAMETKLKEMQERYSKISLKFAEVEGERQQLVMPI